MTLRIEILKVETKGDGLHVTGQGAPLSAPDWSPIEQCSFVVPMRYRKAYYVGRMIDVEVRP